MDKERANGANAHGSICSAMARICQHHQIAYTLLGLVMPPCVQREVEAVAFEHRQRILREEERLRTWRAEAQSALDSREVSLARGLVLKNDECCRGCCADEI